jgi:ADP-ribosyl-[dinitrogen reductase] hydrolase
LAPIPIFYRADPVEAVARAADSSRTTHGAETCVDACRYYTALMVAALNGAGKDELLSEHYAPAGWDWGEAPLVAEIAAIAAGSYKTRNPPEIRGTGYVVETMEAALWAFMHSTDFRSGALLAVNLGDDADTTGAIYGQLAGAFYGASGIPRDWLDRLAQVDELTMLADALAGVRR